MAALNQRYHGQDKPTNVLSFSGQGRFPSDVDEQDMMLLGDIVICLPVLEQEARDQHKNLNAHLTHLLVHGVLHLLDFDHQKDEQAMRMESLEIEILNSLGVSNPYENIEIKGETTK
jgi:probable rRNA maturation factor